MKEEIRLEKIKKAHAFYPIRPDEESEILANMNLTVGEKIEELIEKDDEGQFGAEGKHRVLS